ncbi:hypothetical protein LCGC14_1159700 [marine sediment metagenome]|uniref:Uncharacterized protein n=1 Tax=marine sediment metagenome TaxID=412755 RepID=A0A0F9PYQ9_9ZZZZ|nr:hypothetical protein [Phycisphaerae bacterium]
MTITRHHPALPSKLPSQRKKAAAKLEYPTPEHTKPTKAIPCDADAVLSVTASMFADLSHPERERILVALCITVEIEATCSGCPVPRLTAMIDTLTHCRDQTRLSDLGVRLSAAE